MVILRFERAVIIDKEQLDKITEKIHRPISPGFTFIDINKLLESATRNAIIRPIQPLQDLDIELNNSWLKPSPMKSSTCLNGTMRIESPGVPTLSCSTFPI
jgi:hypothetical protein